MKSNLLQSILILLCSTLFFNRAASQVIGGNAYLIGEFVEVAIDGDAGHEGTADWPGHHSRGGNPEVPFGFVANPEMDLWTQYDGDFFTPGTPENGFGLEINGVNYSNNAWNSATTSTYLQEIPKAPGTLINYTEEDNCVIVTWQGLVAGVRIHVKYILQKSSLYYTTEITLTNETASPINDLYYYRNIDPDNNDALGGTFNTTNKIEFQPDGTCNKALVSAKQSFPHSSFLGIGALGDKFRVSHGGFSNRDGSDIWNATGVLNGTVGDVNTGDEAISLAYKTSLAPGESETFSFSIVMQETLVEAALADLYYITYDNGLGEVGGDVISQCSPNLEVPSCLGVGVTLVINGPNVDDYAWSWSDGGVNDTMVYYLDDSEVITVVGFPTSACFLSPIEKVVFVNFTEGPQTYYDDPGMICGDFDLGDLVYYNDVGGDTTSCIFLSVEPDSATQTTPEFTGPMSSSDQVWLMCSDLATGCYSYVELQLNFVGENSAGPDTSDVLCSGAGSFIDLQNYLNDTINPFGYFLCFDPPGFSIDSSGTFSAVGLEGAYSFYYITEGVDTCLSDTAIINLFFQERPNARFNFEVDGVSSLDGLNKVCYLQEVDFINTSTIEPPGVITDYFWEFGDGTTSTLMNPSHTFPGPGYYLISLTITSDNGCEHEYQKALEVYAQPEMEIVYTEPTCFDSSNAVISVQPDLLVSFTVEISDVAGTILNTGPTVASGLPEGTYFVYLEDGAGCFNTDTISFSQPSFMDVFYHVVNPACMDDSGYVVIDSVVNESPNNPVFYQWNPDPPDISDFGADSCFWMAAGDYSLTVTDSKGCTNTVDFTLINPPPFYFVEYGSDTAYCRLYHYQSGSGFVYAAAAGGVSPYTYQWTYLLDGSTSSNTTWGGRSGGEHLIEVTDAYGCKLSHIVYVDSVNPIADFHITSSQLNENYEGTAPVEVKFTNQSMFFANPNDPLADTLFMWDLFYTNDPDWIITHSYFYEPDTVYEEIGVSYQPEICLIAFNKNGCSDTACKIITIWEPPAFKPVNVFTPNGSGENDVFSFEKYAKGIREFQCIILNRWGVQVAELNHIADYWDGTDMNGDLCSDGVYFYIYTGTADNGEEFEGQGNVTLVGTYDAE